MSARWSVSISLTVSLSAVAVFNLPAAAQTTGGFVTTGNMNQAREDHAAILLSNGLVLIAGGLPVSTAGATADLYNPARGTFTPTGSPPIGLSNSVAISLPNGQAYITDGNNAFVYNTSTGTFSSVISPRFPNNCPANQSAGVCIHAFTLNTGKVLLTDGATAVLYDPHVNTITPTGSPITPRADFSATLVGNGEVLIAGGESRQDGSYLTSAELYNPSSGAFVATGSMTHARADHVAALIGGLSAQAGDVLIVGGHAPNPPPGGPNLDPPGAELYNPGTGTFTFIDSNEFANGQPPPPGFGATATTLADGRVLIAGGAETNDAGSSFSLAEVYDPSTGAFSLTKFMKSRRVQHTATLLPNGNVLIAGGDNGAQTVNTPGCCNTLNSAELFEPNFSGFAPQVRLDMPQAQLVHGTIGVSALVMPSVQWANFYLDGRYFASSPPFQTAVDTTTLSDTPHTLMVIGFTSSPQRTNLGSDSVVFNVGNHQVGFLAPPPGMPASGCLPLGIEVGDSSWFDVYVDGNYQNSNGACIDTMKVGEGFRTLSITGFAQDGSVIGQNFDFIHVANAAANQHAFIDYPVSGSGASATIPIVIAAESGVSWVNVYVDDDYLGSSPPFTFNLDTSRLSNGQHFVSVRGYSSSGTQVATDEAIIQVLN